jgi:hypothetical protein
MVATSLMATDIPGLASSSYYSDDDTPPTTQCTGDPWEYERLVDQPGPS